MLMRGLWKLTWIEIKIFLREPLGAFGTIGVPVLLFVVLGRVTKLRVAPSSLPATGFSSASLPVLVSLLISISAVLSLVTIISIYREGGILKRLRATPLRPYTILTAQVIVKLMLSAATLALMFMAGKRYIPAGAHVLVHPCADREHLEHLVPGLSHCQHRAYRAVCAANRRRDSLSNDRGLRTVCAYSGSSICAADGCSRTSIDLFRESASGNLEWRQLVHSFWGCCGAHCVVSCVHSSLCKGLSLGVAASSISIAHQGLHSLCDNRFESFRGEAARWSFHAEVGYGLKA